MSITEMNPRFASAVRAELAAIGSGHSRLQRQQRRTRALLITVGVLAIAGATTGAAVVVNSLPGTTTVTPLGGITRATHTGTATLDLGPVPTKAGAIVLTVTCLNRQGTVNIPTNPQNRGELGDFTTIYCAGRTTPVHNTMDCSQSRATPRSPSRRTLAPDGKPPPSMRVPSRPPGA